MKNQYRSEWLEYVTAKYLDGQAPAIEKPKPDALLTVSQPQVKVRPQRRLFEALNGYGPFCPFSLDRLKSYGMIDYDIEQALKLGHIEKLTTTTFNGAPAYRKGKNWNL